jgi:SAM-dependent methyltransferase
VGGRWPIVRQLARDMAKAALRPVFRVGAQSLHSITGRVRPLAGRGDHAIVWTGQPQDVPPPELWENYAFDPADYLAGGEQDVATMLDVLAEDGIAPARCVLDLGCAAGRMIRHFPHDAQSELWGLDISTPHIVWGQQNLPRINFATTSTAPHLPFCDGYFDFVYCGSVFTHIADLADAWLLEVRRVLRPGGHAYLTLHDRDSYRQSLTTYAHWRNSFTRSVAAYERRHRIADKDWAMFFFGSDPNSQVFYDRGYISRKWGRWMDVVGYAPQVHNYQSAILLQKPA